MVPPSGSSNFHLGGISMRKLSLLTIGCFALFLIAYLASSPKQVPNQRESTPVAGIDYNGQANIGHRQNHINKNGGVKRQAGPKIPPSTSADPIYTGKSYGYGSTFADSQEEFENLGLYHSNENIRAAAISQLEKDIHTNATLFEALNDPSPVVRVASIQKMIQFEDRENRVFSEALEKLLQEEKDNSVIEEALSYFSLTFHENGSAVIEKVLDRNSLTRNVLAYAAEILHEDYGLDPYTCYETLIKSPSFAAMDHTDQVMLQEDLGSIFVSKSEA